MKLKLNSSLRMKKRYILLSGASWEEVREIILEGIGVIGYGKACPILVENKNNRVLFAVDRKELDSVRACFALTNKKVKVERVSGTIKGVFKVTI